VSRDVLDGQRVCVSRRLYCVDAPTLPFTMREWQVASGMGAVVLGREARFDDGIAPSGNIGRGL